MCSVHRYTMSELRANCLDAVSGQGQGGGCGACVRAHRYTMSEPRRRHVRPWREDEAEMGELTIVCDILKRPTWQGAAVHSFPFRCSPPVPQMGNGVGRQRVWLLRHALNTVAE